MPKKRGRSKKTKAKAALSHLVLCLSGTLSQKRSEFQKYVTSNGGQCKSSVTKAVTHLVTTNEELAAATSKVIKAQSYGIPLVTEEFVHATLKSSGPIDETEFLLPKTVTAKPAKKKTKRKAAKMEQPVKKKSKKSSPKEEPLNYSGMKVAELKALLKERGLPVSGKKADLVARLEGSQDEAPAAAPKKKKKTAKVKVPPKKKAEKKAAAPAAASAPAKKKVKSSGGGRVADRMVPGGRDGYQVIDDYTVKLNQTNMSGGANNNKFYIIQALRGKGTNWCFTRWGRVGEPGKTGFADKSTEEGAVKEFKKKFKSKTKNNWDTFASDRSSFVKHNGKYGLVETDANDEDDGDGTGEASLGKLSEDQIQKGQAVLDQIEAALKSGKKNFDVLSGAFYTLIPTVSGRRRPPPINNAALLNAKKSLLEFWLRMGFDDMDEEEGMLPIEGIMDLPLPASLEAACGGKVSNMGAIMSSKSKGQGLAQSQAGSPSQPMSAELYAAILLYTGNSIYSALNAALRSEDRRKVKKWRTYLRLLLEAMGCMPKKKTKLWRGISVDLYDQYTVGKTITWWSVSSCTADEKVARNFMNGCGGACTLVILDTETAVDVSSLSFYQNEKESLLAPGTQLKVIKRVRKGRVAEIHVKEVGRAFS